MARSSQRATIYDVAASAGVSYQTVSRVINGKGYVAPETRQRITKAMRALDYQPNNAARALVTQRTHTIAVITFELWYIQKTYGMFDLAQSRGYKLIFASLEGTLLNDSGGVFDELVGGNVDGLILITPYHHVPDEQLYGLCKGVPFVLVGNRLGSSAPSVVIDHYRGGQLTAQHLIDLGHRQISHIGGPSSMYDAQARYQAWRDTMAANGLADNPYLEAEFTAEGGYHAAQQLLESNQRFTAVMAGNDHMALGVIHCLRDHGLRVPEDISVVGYDNFGDSAHYIPPLTTVQQDFQALGREAIGYLFSRIEDPDAPAHQRVLRPELIVRQSTAPLLHSQKG